MENYFTPEILAQTLLDAELIKHPKAIKVTSDFMQYLEVKCTKEIININSPQGIRSNFIGIPIFVDNTIEHPYYEFVY